MNTFSGGVYRTWVVDSLLFCHQYCQFPVFVVLMYPPFPPGSVYTDLKVDALSFHFETIFLINELNYCVPPINPRAAHMRTCTWRR